MLSPHARSWNGLQVRSATGQILATLAPGDQTLLMGPLPKHRIRLPIASHLEVTWHYGEPPFLRSVSGVCAGVVLFDGQPLTGDAEIEQGSRLQVKDLRLSFTLLELPDADSPLLEPTESTEFRFPGTRPFVPVSGTYTHARELHDVLRGLEREEQTGSLRVDTGGRAGLLVFFAGKLMGARLDELGGLDALARICATASGAYRLSAGVTPTDDPLDIKVSDFLKRGYWETRRHGRPVKAS